MGYDSFLKISFNFLKYKILKFWFMASSFINQVPVIINLIQRLKPNKVLYIGKGFGKYGFLQKNKKILEVLVPDF